MNKVSSTKIYQYICKQTNIWNIISTGTDNSRGGSAYSND